MRTFIITSLMLVMGTLGTFAPVSSAQAFSAQNFHGNICQPNSEILDKIRYTDVGIKATQNATIRCPLATVSREITRIAVNVKETSVPSTLCALHVVGFTGVHQVNPIFFEIPQGQRFANVPIPESAKGPTTVYNVTCKLPAEQTLTELNVVVVP
jgi:hypothetical protein